MTPFSGAFGAAPTVLAAYQQVGKRVYLRAEISNTNNGTADVNVAMSLPVNARTDVSQRMGGTEIGLTNEVLVGQIYFQTLTIRKRLNAYPGGTGAVYSMEGFYEAA